MIFIGLDDTDVIGTPGTGHLARDLAAELSAAHEVLGVVRQQLLVDPRVPCTKNNSSAALVLNGAPADCVPALLEQVRGFMLARFTPGSDPGLCVAATVPPAVAAFGRRAQCELVTQAEARALAAEHGLALVGLGGTEDGVIGALAAVGLTAGGEAGRYVQVGRSRELTGLQPVAALLAAGIAAVQTPEGEPVTEGLILTDKLRPARRGGWPVAIVTWNGEYWVPLKLD